MSWTDRAKKIVAVVAVGVLAACSGRSAVVAPSKKRPIADAGLLGNPSIFGHFEPRGIVALKILGFNDFHGHLAEGSRVNGRPAGGAAVLASYLRAAMRGREERSLIVHAGDHIGASPPESALLQDEPSIQFLNTLANDECRQSRERQLRCNVVGTLGNHEFDEGQTELLRMLDGGNFKSGPYLQNPYPGAAFTVVNANVFVQSSGKHFITPSLTREIGGVRVGIVGAVLKGAPKIVTPTAVAGLDFRDEADSINEQVGLLKQQGVRTIIVTLHQGAAQSPTYAGSTDPSARVGDPIASIVSRLDGEVDLVISGHSHTFTNALLPTATDSKALVVQAYSFGTAYDDIDLEVDLATGDVVAKSARIVTTYSDVPPGNSRDPRVQAIVDSANEKVKPMVTVLVARIQSDITQLSTAAGESALGDLIADAQRAATGADIAFMNPGGIRADLLFAANASNAADSDGAVLWGELFTVQPFGNQLITLRMTGQHVMDVLNQQWPSGTILQVSGLNYTWDSTLPEGHRVVQAKAKGKPLELARSYKVTVNSFVAAGGGGFSAFRAGTDPVTGANDLDALVTYLKKQPQPVASPRTGRITRRK